MGGFFTLLACPLIGLAQGGDYSAKQSIIQGIDRFERGEAGSDSLFAQGESHSTLSAVASYNRGRALMESAEKGAEARQAFQKSLKGNDDTRMQSDAWHNIGNSLLMEQDPENAIEAYKAALRANPQNEAARYNLSYALRMLNDEQEQNEQDQQGEGEQEQNEQEQNEQEQEGEGEQEQNEQEQNEQDQQGEGEQEQSEQDQQGEGEQEQNEQEQQGEGEQEQNEQEQQGEGEQEQNEQEQQGEGEQPAAPEQIEGQISKEDMERILESLERGEEEVQAKLMRAKSQGKKKKIEKDW